jgi:sugar O-acyltransferase (sialic acid O-acetyltransferase NeuD family)
MTRLVIFGLGPVAEIAHFYFTHDSSHEVVAFTVDEAHLDRDLHRDLPVVPFEDVARRFPPGEYGMFVAIGYSRMNRVREAKYRQAKELGYELPSYVSSKATTWPDLQIGDNCLVMEDVVIQPFVRIGCNTILWSACHIGHEAVVGDHCFISSHAVVSGFVTVDSNCFLGSNATTRDGITVARETVIGAGAVVLKSTQPRGVYVASRSELLEISSDRLPSL